MSGTDETSEPKKLEAFTPGERELYERLIAHLEDKTELLTHDREMLLKQLEVKDRQLEAKDVQIDRFFSSERDTKTLLGSLQSLMNALWPGKQKELGDRYVPMRDALESGLDRDERDGGRGA